MNLVKFLEDNPDIVPKGKIVAIAKRNLKSYCGSLNLNSIVYKCTGGQTMADETSERPGFEIYEFVPVDNRFPSFFMRSFNIQSLAKKRIMVEFDDWPSFSKQPLCHFVRIIGDEGSNKAEGDVILL